jgi:hypothetical protein
MQPGLQQQRRSSEHLFQAGTRCQGSSASPPIAIRMRLGNLSRVLQVLERLGLTRGQAAAEGKHAQAENGADLHS